MRLRFDVRPSAFAMSLTICTAIPVGVVAASSFTALEDQDKERVGTTGRARTPPRPDAARTNEGWTRGPRGYATYYAKVLEGLETASGTTFDNDHMVAAHPTYPFGTLVRVTNLQNGRSVVVRVVDRGPAPSARAKGNIIDLSRAAAEKLGFLEAGRARVRLEYREPDRADDEDAVTSADARRTEPEADR